MKDNYSINVTLRCIACGDSDFSSNEDKSWLKCNRCEREYSGGGDELVALNEATIQEEVGQMKKEVAQDAQADLMAALKKAFKGKGNIRLK